MRSKAIILVLLAVCICGSLTSKFEEPLLYEKFPPGFIWAAGSSAYQVEGGWDADGKGLSIWDTFTANASAITQGATGKIACDSYHLYQKDVELLKSLNVTHYRFSISWSRILPDGVGMINQAGLSYYRRLVASLNAANIKPMIVLYFWDLPQALEDKGGWLNPKTIDWFVEYARVCFTELGNNVQLWITINDPWTVAKKGYGDGTLAPGKYGPGTYTYKVGRNLLLAHAKVYRLYQESFKAIQKGKVGIGLNSRWYQSKDNKTENIDAAERAMMFMIGWFANPIFGSGDYPSIMKQKIGEKSRLQNLTNPSRLPELTADEQRLVKGSSDFLGLTHYTSTLVENQPSNKSDISYDADQDVKTSYDPDWPATETSWLKIAPLGIKYTLQWVKDRFNNPEVIIIDNGISDRGGGNTNDMQRIFSLKYYLNNVLRAVKSGVNVTGYTTTLMDSFDWVSGYKEKFGLFVVNFSSPELTRTAKASSKYYAQIIRDNGFVKYENQSCTSSSQTKEKGSCSASTSTHSQHSSAAVMATLIFMLSIEVL